MNISKFNSRKFILAGIFLLSFLIQGCFKAEESDLEKQARQEDELIQQYLKTNNIQANKQSSGYYSIKTQANDNGQTVKKGDILSIYYQTSLLNGTPLYSLTPSMGPPAKLRHGSKALVPIGLDAGLSQMKKGEKYTFILPSGLAFSSFSNNKLPANSIIIVEAELVDIETNIVQEAIEDSLIQKYITEKQLTDVQTFPSGLRYQRTTAGAGDKPSQGRTVKIHYTGKFLNDSTFDKSKSGSPLSYQIGSQGLIKGFAEGISIMREGEKGKIFVPSHLGYGQSLQVIPLEIRKEVLNFFQLQDYLIPPFTPLLFEVELTEIQ